MASNGYELPSSITVSGATYTWDQTSGELTLSNPTGNVSITIIAVKQETESVNIIDTVGYKDNTRISTSDGVTEKEMTGYTTTGMFAMPKSSTLKTSGVNFDSSTYTSAYAYRYDADTGEFVTAYKCIQTGIGGATFTVDTNGNLTIVTADSWGDNVKLRLVGYGTGANLVVTIE